MLVLAVVELGGGEVGMQDVERGGAAGDRVGMRWREYAFEMLLRCGSQHWLRDGFYAALAC